MSVINIHGQKVMEKKFTGKSKIDFSKLAIGVYYLIFNFENNFIKTYTVIKKE